MGLTKFCPHIIAWNSDILDFIGRTRPAIIKVVGPFGHNTEYLKEAKRRSPDSKWLFRLYRNNQSLNAPSYNADLHAYLMRPYKDFYDIFEGYNEIDPRDHSKDPPGPLDIEIIKRYNEFDSRLANIVNLEWGKEYCALNWSNGQPPDEAWEYLQDALNRADYIGLHNYGWETLPDCPQFALRHRRIFNLLPVKKLMILSEVGMTNAVFGGPDLGWKSWLMPPTLYAKERRAAAVWAWFLDRINENPYVVGVNAYTTGRLKGDNWGTHDFTPRLYKLVGDYILGHPSPDPYLPNGGNNMENPIKVGIRENYRIWNSPIVEIKIMEMEEYLRYCIPYEMYASWEPEALKAGTVVARTYATWMREHGKHSGFDLCNSACCQVMGPDTDYRTNKAVKDTEDILIMHQGKPIKAKYFSFCGGRTADGGEPYLKPVHCRCFEIAPEDTPVAKHTHGMCQWGAEEMAREHATCEEIIEHYYTLEKPDPNWEAKYKELKFRVKEKADILDDISGEMYRVIEGAQNVRKRVQNTRDELDKMIE